jgi:hypothetical protein
VTLKPSAARKAAFQEIVGDPKKWVSGRNGASWMRIESQQNVPQLSRV